MKVEPSIIFGNTIDGVCLEITDKSKDSLLLLFEGSELIAGALVEEDGTRKSFKKLTKAPNHAAIIANWVKEMVVPEPTVVSTRLVKNLEEDISDLNVMNILRTIRG